ncbi:polyhydroxyalkanoate depolymerase [Aquibaculum arenosum]|uniref:Polyhydroxyalkanoate depolymerase n=1 Tax=Aquibaculum arenosum TaxID=3032591 RepID=A0ABT5YJL7_9PROT|nr:polyhydroxyalkanoate depolymerase [Fodinicurvata sp. CAU 1616]MDF2095135.1 polyhydroxyalkanoate depolymerase [Fodinicurvata sp. CAU 1616]
MLYQIYEFQHTALMPWRMLGNMTQGLLSNPLFPATHTHAGRSLKAGLEVFDHATRQRERPAWGIDRTEVEGREVAVSLETELDRPYCTLLHFKRQGCAERKDPRILLVAPLSGHYATLLRGTVQALLPDHEVWITDWKDAREVPADAGPFGIENYIDEVLRYIRHLGPDVHVMAVCQPAPLVLASVALLAQAGDAAQPRSMILMGGPVDIRAAPTQVTRFAESRPLSWFQQSLIAQVPAYYPGAGREVYPGFLQLGGFISMNPARHFESHVKMFRHLVQGDGDSVEAHRRFYDEYLAVMDVPADYYLQTVDQVFQRQVLARGQMTWRGLTVRPEAIRHTALMTVEGEMDDISAPGQTLAAHDLCASLPKSMRANHLQPSVGHYGIFNGRRWREEIKPAIGAFVRKHAQGSR